MPGGRFGKPEAPAQVGVGEQHPHPFAPRDRRGVPPALVDGLDEEVLLGGHVDAGPAAGDGHQAVERLPAGAQGPAGPGAAAGGVHQHPCTHAAAVRRADPPTGGVRRAALHGPARPQVGAGVRGGVRQHPVEATPVHMPARPVGAEQVGAVVRNRGRPHATGPPGRHRPERREPVPYPQRPQGRLDPGREGLAHAGCVVAAPLEQHHRTAGLGESAGGGRAGRAGTDDGDVSDRSCAGGGHLSRWSPPRPRHFFRHFRATSRSMPRPCRCFSRRSSTKPLLSRHHSSEQRQSSPWPP